FTNTIVDWLRRRCSVLLAVMGPDWLESRDPQGRRRLDQEDDWVRCEIAEAFNLGVTVVSILLRETSLPREDDLPAEIAPMALRQYWRLRHRAMHDDLAGLINRLAEIDPNLMAPPTDAAAAAPPGPGRPDREDLRRVRRHVRLTPGGPGPVGGGLAGIGQHRREDHGRAGPGGPGAAAPAQPDQARAPGSGARPRAPS